jgi:membrane protease YdiL (CAAX protease family)
MFDLGPACPASDVLRVRLVHDLALTGRQPHGMPSAVCRPAAATAAPVPLPPRAAAAADGHDEAVQQDASPVDTPPVDTPPVDTPPVDTPPVDTPPVDTPPVDTPPVDTPPSRDASDRRRTGAEILIVLGLSLGASALYAVIDLIGKLTAGPPLSSQTATLNAPASPRPYLDLSYQLAGIAVTLMPVALALFLLSATGPGPGLRAAARRIGLDARRPWTDLAAGAVLAAVIGLPGLGLYFAGRRLGITADVVPTALTPYWWTVPVLVAQAVKNAVIEEVVVVGYLISRLRRLGWPTWAVLGASAALRGSYHLYQGFGPFIGNAAMGVVFGEWFRRRGRVMPLVLSHTLLDLVAFVGYQYFASKLGLR